MSDIAIKVENLSKVFHIGVKDRGLLSERISHGIKSFFSRNGKSEDPTEFWALRDINFEIKKGDAVGIIGRNGAGKSTLLKILSRITEPTTGRVTINGRVASLLEVGTGFHPELTGRENIFMNGAILGMKRAEIKRKFDEIVEFSGIEKFIDTPVKHYSSGMYVRLAFAVAAHLEPEILIIDEVLAVGDAEFQKKCLGKMEDVAKNQGRTVLFVSHNMSAVQSFCSNAILLKQGRIASKGNSSEVINVYLSKELKNCIEQSWERFEEAPGNDEVRIKKVKLMPKSRDETNNISIEAPIEVLFEIWNKINNANLNLALHFYAITGELIFVTTSEVVRADEGLLSFRCYFPENFLNDGVYTISIMIVNNAYPVYMYEQCLTFEVTDVQRGFGWQGKWPGMIRPKLGWQITVHQEEETE